MAIYTIVIAAVWQSVALCYGHVSCGARGVDDSLVKAAKIDGANGGELLARDSFTPAPVFSARSLFFLISPLRALIWFKRSRVEVGYASDLPDKLYVYLCF